jgi:hypothetical protein
MLPQWRRLAFAMLARMPSIPLVGGLRPFPTAACPERPAADVPEQFAAEESGLSTSGSHARPVHHRWVPSPTTSSATQSERSATQQIRQRPGIASSREGCLRKALVEKRGPYIRKVAWSGTFDLRFDRVGETSSFYHCKGITEREFSCIPNGEWMAECQHRYTSAARCKRVFTALRRGLWYGVECSLDQVFYGWPANCAKKPARFPLIDLEMSSQ